MGILRNGLQGMGRLGRTVSVFPIWDARCRLGPKFSANLGYDILLVFEAQAVGVAVGLSPGAIVCQS